MRAAKLQVAGLKSAGLSTCRGRRFGPGSTRYGNPCLALAAAPKTAISRGCSSGCRNFSARREILQPKICKLSGNAPRRERHWISAVGRDRDTEGSPEAVQLAINRRHAEILGG